MTKARKTTTRKPRKRSRKPAPTPVADPFEFPRLEPCTRYDLKVTAIIVLGMVAVALLVAAVSVWL